MKPSRAGSALLEDPDCTVSMLLHEQAIRQPDAVALLAPGRLPLTYADLWSQVQHVTSVLRSHGVTPSVRVAVMLPNGPEMAAAFLGVAACVTCVPLNPGYQAAEFRVGLEDVGAGLVIVRKGERGPLRNVSQDMGLTVLEIEADATLAAGQFRMGFGLSDVTEPRSLSQSHDVALLLRTSGTTGRPKIVPISHASLLASVRCIVHHFALSSADRCLNVRTLFHVNGLLGNVLATVASGGSVVCTAGLDGDAFFDWVAQYKPTWYSAVPTMYQWVIAHGALYRQRAPDHRFRFLRSGASPLSPATLRSLEELLGAPVIETYGMTERTPIAINPLPPGLRKPGSVGLPAGVEIALLDEAGGCVPAGAAGEIAIKGPGVIERYENNPDANASAFIDGWFRTGDQGRFDEDGYLFITGRLKEIVNRGGQKISPRDIDEALLEHPAVAQVAAFGVPHPTLGEELAAAVVLRDGSTVEECGLRSFLFERLAQFKVPSTIIFVDALPLGATGKVQRADLCEKLGSLIAKDFVSPRTDTQRSLESIFREVLACGPLGLHDSFFTLGGDSLTGVRAMARINEQHGVALAVPMLFRHPTIAELAVEVDAAKALSIEWSDELAAEIAQMSDEEVTRLLERENASSQ